MREKHVAQIRKFLRESKSACDDQHQFNPSEFDMENCMRINLKPDYEESTPRGAGCLLEFTWLASTCTVL